MSTAEALIRKRLIADSELASALASYCNTPAVFFQEAPGDSSESWGESQFPRIVFITDTFSDPEHDKRKSLSIDIMCSSTGTMPEGIEPYVRKSLAGVFFTPDGGTTFSAKWRDSQVFKENVGDRALREPLILGMTMTFDIYEYPSIESGDPDPIAAINKYAVEWDKNLVVIGLANLPGIYEPSRSAPAAYFSKGTTYTDRQTNTVVWLNTELIAHFFAPNLSDRIEWLEQFSQSLALDGEIIMLDTSPMFLRSIKGDASADEISGQLKINMQYGLLRRPKYAHALEKVKVQ